MHGIYSGIIIVSESEGSTNPEPEKASDSKKPVDIPVAKRNVVNSDTENSNADAAASADNKSGDHRKVKKSRNEQGIPSKPESQKPRSGIIQVVDKVVVFLAKAAAFGLVAGVVGVAAAYVLREYSANTENEPDPFAAATERMDALQQDIAGLKDEIQRLAIVSESNAELQSAAAELSQNSDLQAASLEALRTELSDLSEAERLADASTEDRFGRVDERLTQLESFVSSFGEQVDALEDSLGTLSQAAAAEGANEMASTGGRPSIADLENPTPEPAAGTRGSDAGPATVGELGSVEVARIDGQIAELNARLDALSESKAEAGRYDELERRLEGLAASVQAIQSASEDVQLPPELEGRIEALSAQVESISADLAAAGSPQSRSIALVGVRAAAETGAPYGVLLLEAGFTDAEIPEIVRVHQETGIATMAELRESFPEASRAAVRAAELASDPGSVAGGIGSLLRSIFQVRPLTPIEGNDPPALLSQAEALVRANRLRDAIKVLDALPEPSRLAMDGWLERANARLNVMEALDGMANSAREG